MTILSNIVIVAGLLLFLFGVWMVGKCVYRDGAAPPAIFGFIVAGALVMCVGGVIGWFA
jgi:hypothetical protein